LQKTDVKWDIYKDLQNFYFTKVDHLRDEYDEKRHADIAGGSLKSPKKWWNLVNNLMGNTKRSSYPSLIKDGVVFDTEESKAEVFNDTYLESQNLPDDPNVPPGGTMIF
jgi:hypothetical protein